MRARLRVMVRRLTGNADQCGFTLVELVVALGLLAIVAVGFMLSIGGGFRAIAVARQRTVASELASKRLENLRNVPFERIAINRTFLQPTDPPLVHSDEPDHPNHFISADNTAYDVTGNGDFEELIIDDVDGEIDYIDDPVQVGTTIMEVYQYATWVDDPDIPGTHDYRRITVVVRYKAPAAAAVSKILRSSTLFTPGNVVIDSANTTVPVPEPTTVPGPVTTTTVPDAPPTTVAEGSCLGDVAPPTGEFTIGAAAGAEVGFTAVPTVSLHMSFDDSCTPIVANFSNDGVNWSPDVTYEATSSQLSWTLSAGSGTKTVYGRVRDGVGNVVDLVPQSIELDVTAPTVPGNVSRTVSCSGSNRTVAITWSSSTDAEGNLRGYRVFRSTDGTTWNLVASTAGTSYSEAHSKTLSSVRFYVASYDAAGNMSAGAPNPVISLGKNQCS